MSLFAEFYKKNRISVFVTIITVFLMYSKHAFNTYVGVDSEQFIQELYGKEWLLSGLGRFGTYYSVMALNLGHYNPYMNGLMFLLFFVVAVLGWMFVFYLYSGKKQMPLWLFSITFISYPIWAHQFYFVNQMAAMMFAMFLQAVSFALLYFSITEGGKTLRTLIAAVGSVMCGVWAFGTYQAFVGFHLATAACLIFLDLDRLYASSDESAQKEVHRKWWKDVAYIVGHFLLCFGVYEMILKVFKMGQSGYLSVTWGTAPFSDIARVVLGDYIDVFLGRDEYAGFILICGTLVVVLSGTLIKKTPLVTIDYVIAFVGSIIGMGALNIAIGSLPAYRARYAVGFTCGFVGMYGLYILLTRQRNVINRVVIAAVSFVCLISLMEQVGAVMRMFYSIDICNEQQYIVGTNIKEEIIRAYGNPNTAGLPVVIVGKWDAPLNKICVKKEQIGVSSFCYDYYDGDRTSATRRSVLYMNAAFGTDYALPDDNMRAAAMQAAEGMPSYPMAGCVAMQDGFVVVKLSE